MQHLLAYYKSVLSSGTLAELTPVPDSLVTINDNDIYVPNTVNQVVRLAHGAGNTRATQAQIESPSLRAMFFPSITPYESAASFDDPGRVVRLDKNPLALVPTEGLEFWSDGGGDGTTAQGVYGLVLLADGPLQPVTGKIFSIRGTLAANAAAGAWNSSAITFGQTLPNGTYDVVGLRVEGTGLVAARLIFVGPQAGFRPGVLCQSADSVAGVEGQRYGELGTLGSFSQVTPPSIEVIGGTSTSQTVYLDLIKRS